MSTMSPLDAHAVTTFESLGRAAREVTEAALRDALERRAARVRDLGADDARALVEEITALSLRGGKRLRAVLVAATYQACGGAGGPSRIAPALAAMELLQTYLLIHDDWMDKDDVRRGGPSVHASLRARYGSEREGDVAAILAGDLAAAFALEELSRCEVPAPLLVEATLAYARMQADVVIGQQLDVRAGAADHASVERVHDLKTGSYTVRGPVALGAILAGASPDLRALLDAFARPLGIAFQLRDDLLGAFGDPRVTGKPSGGDLVEGKRTALLADLLEGGGDDARAVALWLAAPAEARTAVAPLLDRLVSSGAKARVEARLARLLAESRAALERAGLGAAGTELLRGAIAVFGEREA